MKKLFALALTLVLALSLHTYSKDKEDVLIWRQPKTLHVKYSSHRAQVDEGELADWGSEKYFTGDEYEFIYPDESGHSTIEYASESLRTRYYYEYDWEKYIWTDPSPGWKESSRGNPIIGGGETYSYWGKDNNPGGEAFYPLNAFAKCLIYSTGQIYQLITPYRQKGKLEKILDVNCEIFVVDETTYWVDPATHYTLKIQYKDGSFDLVQEYDTNFKGGIPHKPGSIPNLPQ